MASVSVKLSKAYRGYRAGDVIQVTPQLAARLVAQRLGVPEAARPMFENAERAVAHPAVEMRGDADAP